MQLLVAAKIQRGDRIAGIDYNGWFACSGESRSEAWPPCPDECSCSLRSCLHDRVRLEMLVGIHPTMRGGFPVGFHLLGTLRSTRQSALHRTELFLNHPQQRGSRTRNATLTLFPLPIPQKAYYHQRCDLRLCQLGPHPDRADRPARAGLTSSLSSSSIAETISVSAEDAAARVNMIAGI